MWNMPNKEQLSEIPGLYATESVPLRDKIVHEHLFIFGCDWFVCEYDGEDIFWGFCILNEDYLNAEWGYVSLGELREINIKGVEIDRDLYWKKRRAIDVEKIAKCHGWNETLKGKDHAKSEELPDRKRESAGYVYGGQVSSMS